MQENIMLLKFINKFLSNIITSDDTLILGLNNNSCSADIHSGSPKSKKSNKTISKENHGNRILRF